MKIRKTIQGSIPSNKVYNSHNVDKHNTYSTEYLNDKLVHVGPNGPVNGEEVWIQKGKNLVSKHENGITDLWQVALWATCELKPYTNYTLSFRCNVDQPSFYANEFLFVNQEWKSTSDRWAISFTTLGEETFQDQMGKQGFCILKNSTALSAAPVFTEVQIEYGTEATEYEPYIGKRIYTKDANNNYDILYDKTNEEKYSKQEQRIGTWINGKPLYRQVVTLDKVTSNTVTTHPVDLSNIESLVHVHGTFVQNNNLGETSSGVFMPLSTNWRVDDNLYDAGIHTITESSFSLFMGPGMWAPRNVIVVFEYTKTTD